MHLKLAIIVLFIAESLYSVDFNEYLEKYLVDKQKLDHIKVDFFIIQNLSIEDEDLQEKWKELDELELSNHLIKIKTEPTTFVTFPEGKFSDEITLPPLKFKIQPEQQSLSDEVAEVTKPDPFLYEKIPFQKEMVEIENNLNRSRDYRVIYYNSWYQPVFKENETIPIFIDAQKKDKKVHGEIKIYKERFIHLVSKLRFSQKTDEIDNSSRTQEIKTFQTLIKDKNETKNKGFLNDDYWVETIFNSVKVNLKYIGDLVYSDTEINSEEIIVLPQFKFVDLFLAFLNLLRFFSE